MARCYNQIYLKDKDITVDCGKCLNCLSNKAKEYGMRMQQEADRYKSWYFFTLTYNDLTVPWKNNKLSLRKDDITKMIKRINKDVKKRMGEWRYFVAGEYGERTKRPHYHMVAFSTVPILETVRSNWNYGQVDRQIAWSYKAISYTVGYANKKIGMDWDKRVEKPFNKFSKGIGREWIHEAIAKQKINEEHYFIETQNYINRIPAYYKKILKEHITGVKIKYLKKHPLTGEVLKGTTYKLAEFPEKASPNASAILMKRLKLWDKFIERINYEDDYTKRYWYYRNKYGTNDWHKNFDWKAYCKENELDYKKYDKVISKLIEKENRKLKNEAETKYWSKKIRDAV